MEKGFNTTVIEAKKKLVSVINEIAKEEIPFSVISLILENALQEVNMVTQQHVEQEKEKYKQMQKVQEEQVEYVSGQNAEPVSAEEI